jgi:uncharacterized protein
MSTKIFVNLAVKDLNRSVDFFKAIGYSFNKQFTDETAACIVISEDIYAMLLTEKKFKDFTPKQLVDATKATEVMTCLSTDTREKVNEIVDNAVKAGATEFKDAQDHGFMFYRSFSDLDGHIWEIMWMDESKVETQK